MTLLGWVFCLFDDHDFGKPNRYFSCRRCGAPNPDAHGNPGPGYPSLVYPIPPAPKPPPEGPTFNDIFERDLAQLQAERDRARVAAEYWEPTPEAGATDHCWHPVDCYCTGGKKHPGVRCCFCSEWWCVRDTKAAAPAGHGPYAPDAPRVPVPKPEGPCPERS